MLLRTLEHSEMISEGAGEPRGGRLAPAICLSSKKEKSHPRVPAFISQNSPCTCIRMYVQIFSDQHCLSQHHVGETRLNVNQQEVFKLWHNHIMKYHAVVKTEINFTYWHKEL